jgi:hypothetical protein
MLLLRQYRQTAIKASCYASPALKFPEPARLLPELRSIFLKLNRFQQAIPFPASA